MNNPTRSLQLNRVDCIKGMYSFQVSKLESKDFKYNINTSTKQVKGINGCIQNSSSNSNVRAFL